MKENNILVVAGEIETLAARKDKSIKLVLGTQELTPETAGQLYGLQSAFIYLAIKKERFQVDEMEMLNHMKSKEVVGKSKSQRLRSVIFINWKKNNEGYDDFNHYYDSKMEKFIQHCKNQIDQ